MDYINACRICKNENIRKFFDLGNQPLANSLLNMKDQYEKSYPLSLSWCPDCNLIQLNETIDPEELFSTYIWVTGTSKGAREHSNNFFKKAVLTVPKLKDGYILEVASNDGTFLMPFQDNNYKVLGVDPAKNIVEIAQSKGIPTVCGFFGEELADKIIKEHGKSKFVFARNVVAHVANLHDFMKGIGKVVEDDGVVALESHYAKKICEELQYDSIYHEHLCYYTLGSTERLLNLHGFTVFDVVDSPISGGAFIVYASKNKREETESFKKYREAERNAKINDLSRWQEFSEKAFEHKKSMIQILDECKKNNEKIIGYGASARSSTLMNFCGIDSRYIQMIADKNPLKYMKYSPGTHILIDDPINVMKTNPDTILLLAWNFTKEVLEYLDKDLKFQGKVIVPLPNKPEILEMKNDI